MRELSLVRKCKSKCEVDRVNVLLMKAINLLSLLCKIYALSSVALDFSVHIIVCLLVTTHWFHHQRGRNQSFWFSMCGACRQSAQDQDRHKCMQHIHWKWYLEWMVFVSKLIGEAVYVFKLWHLPWDHHTEVPESTVWQPVLAGKSHTVRMLFGFDCWQ